MPYLALEHVTKHYPRQAAPAVRDITLTVEQGQLLALLGPSGSGKSTILKLIAGIEQLDAGRIVLDGRDLRSVPANRRGAVLMFQKAYLFPFLSVADNIAFGLKVQRASRQTIQAEVARMLELVGLPGFERRRPVQLSGGEQQRVALARALVTQPRLLMLDEPLSSLDTAVRQTLQEAIGRIQRELGITALLVTHDLSEAIAMSDRTAILVNGTIAACGTPQQVFQRPPTQAAARFVGVSTFLAGRLEHDCLHTAFGPLRVPFVTATPRQTMVAIRPEHIRLLGAPTANALPGTLLDTTYKGEFTDVRVQLGDTLLRGRQYGARCVHAPGAAVYVHFPPEHLFEVVDEG